MPQLLVYENELWVILLMVQQLIATHISYFLGESANRSRE